MDCLFLLLTVTALEKASKEVGTHADSPLLRDKM